MVFLFLAILLAASFIPPAAAQAPVLVRDLQPGDDPESYGSHFTRSSLVAAGGRIYFLTSTRSELRIHGLELWTSDLSETSSARVRGFYPDRCLASHKLEGVELVGGALVFTILGAARFSEIHDQGLWITRGTADSTTLLVPGLVSDLTAVADLVFFLHKSGTYAPETLWRTDGTQEGTFELGPRTENALFLNGIDGRLFFLRRRGPGYANYELWVSDGTVDGTERLIADIWPFHSPPDRLTVAGKRFFFVVQDDLWTTDGTVEGTYSLYRTSTLYDPSLHLDPFPVMGERIFFIDRTAGSVLWTSDGTPEGTRRVATVCDVTTCTLKSSNSAIIGDRLFFQGQDEAHGVELWTSDGTAEGTALLRDLRPGPLDSHPRELTPSGDLLFFGASTDSSQGMWTTDGTPEGTVQTFTGAEIDTFIPDGAGKVAFYGSHHEPWVSDGTAAGSFEIMPEVEQGEIEGFFEGRFVFRVRRDLWANDGTPGGTWRLGRKVANWPLSSRPASFTHLGPRLAFTAQTGSLERSVFLSDGTAEGTHRLAPGLEPRVDHLVASAGRLFFNVGHELWTSDGTEEGSELFAPASGDAEVVALEPFAENLYFVRGTGWAGELWKSDGTPGGSRVFTETANGDRLKDTYDLEVVGDLLYFLSSSEAHWGRSLYGTDGSVAGTRLLAEEVREKAVLGEVVYFLAGDDFSNALWRTDGTVQGTEPVRSITGFPRSLVAGDDRLFFILLDGGFFELWTSDGTEEGTRRVAQYDDGPHPLGLYVEHPLGLYVELFAAGGRVYFLAPNGDVGDELYVSDGQSVELLKDICPGRCSSLPRHLTWIDGRLYFSANDGATGWEPWTSDGTRAGTVRVADLAPGPASSRPQGFYGLEGTVYFQADDGVTGHELWALPLSEHPCKDGSACLLGGRFQVTVRFNNPNDGVERPGRPVPFSDETSLFWFFNESNVELAVKLLDGRRLNDHFWFFSGGLSNVEYWIDVTDRTNGTTRTYHNPPGEICGQSDVRAFFDDTRSRRLPAPLSHTAAKAGGKAGSCVAAPTSLCLQDGRFEVTVEWQAGDGKESLGRTIPATDESGYFYFFNERNLELVVKLLDGRRVNEKFWFFYGALSDVEYRITVTDTETGARRVYHNPQGEICGRADITAF